jgi:thiamine pyrophosphokinase
MDSLEEAGGLERLARYPPESVRRYQRDKDFTDTELALDALRELGAKFIRLIGGGGGRLDHLLAVRELFERPFFPVTWHTRNENIYALEPDGEPLVTKFKTECGGTVSLLPAGDGPWIIESEGLKWAVTNLEWKRGVFGICNIAPEGSFLLTVRKGRFLLILPHKDQGIATTAVP